MDKLYIVVNSETGKAQQGFDPSFRKGAVTNMLREMKPDGCTEQCRRDLKRWRKLKVESIPLNLGY